jgi:tetrathionate reductase subunit B
MRYGMIIDLTECVRCRGCCISCKAANRIPTQFDISGKPARLWYEEHPIGTYPNVFMSFAVYHCMHCDNPACVEVCPTGAMQKRDDGIVTNDKDVCIGCKKCVDACPYGIPYYREDLKVVDKCDFCADRLVNGRLPACVEKCPGEAMVIGDLDDPSSVVSLLLAEGEAKPLSPELGTKPNVYYIGSEADLKAMEERKNESIEVGT